MFEQGRENQSGGGFRALQIILVYFFCSVCGGYGAAQAQQSADVLLEQGQKLYNEEKFDEAITILRRDATQRPNDPNVFFLLAAALTDQGALQEAETVYRKTILLYQQQQAREAGSGVTYQPNIAMCVNNVAVIYQKEKKYDQAETTIQLAMSVWHNAKTTPANFFVTQGIIYQGQNKNELALGSFQTALAREPRNAEALLNLGILLGRMGKKDEAVEILRKGAEAAPDDSDVFAALGSAMAAKESWGEAVTAYRKSVELRPDVANVYYNLGDALRHAGKNEEAIDALRKAHALAPDDAVVTASLGTLLHEEGQKQEAAVLLKGTVEGAETDRADAVTSYAQASALQAQGQTAAAILAVLKALEFRADFPEASALLGSLLIETNKLNDAETIVGEALAKHDDSADLHNAYGLVMLAERKLKQAEEHFQRALGIRPTYEDAHVNHAAILNLEQHGILAIPEFQQVLRANPKNLKAQSSLGATFFDLHRYAAASEAFALAVDLSPNDPDLRANLALSLQKAGRTAEAKKAFAESRRLRGAAATRVLAPH